MVVRLEAHLAAFAGLFIMAACSQLPAIVPPPPPPAPLTTSTAISDLEREVHRLINRHRQAVGLGQIAPDPVLDALAREHSERMAREDVPVGHDGFEDRFNRARAALTIARFAENVGMNSGYPAAAVPAQMVDGWIASPGHRANLQGRFRISGVGIARSASGSFFGTQLFAE